MIALFDNRNIDFDYYYSMMIVVKTSASKQK